MESKLKSINVAPSSFEGHFIQKAKKVINLDEVNETYIVKGESQMVTKNHTTLKNKQDCMITCQQVYNPFSKAFEKSID